MANIKITTGNNKVKNVKGRLSFETNLIENEEGEKIIAVKGQMTTHRYFEEIEKIETDRYLLEDITVYNEVFGSEDFKILYNFVANSYLIKGGESNLSEELIAELEKQEFSDDDSMLWEGDEKINGNK